ncbi:MAG TPA: c-type cytochrome [Balneolales bacterium]|nr:c-type cytochrome [Balneolales bacterium]
MERAIIVFFLITAFLSWGCSSNKKSKEQKADGQTERADGGLTQFQIENGIGPVTKELEPGPVNDEMAAKGKELFDQNCSSCHKIGERYVGPDLQDVTSRRTPAYVMNMMLNPTGMTQKHPTAHKLLEKFATQMANMHLTREQARSVLEYLRSVNPNSQK